MILTDADELRLALVGAEASLVAEREHSERLQRECEERHDELRRECDDARAALRTVAERQREADARNVCGDTCRRAIRRTPLVTEGDK